MTADHPVSMRRATALACAVALAAVAGCSAHHSRAAAAVASVATPTAAGSPSPSAAPAVFPLTGLPTRGSHNAGRPPLSVKVDNAPGALPQLGLDRADIVAEALVEGGLTRLFAVYQSKDAAAVGPVRSARPVDAQLLRLFGAVGGIFAFSGAAPGEIAPTLHHGNATLFWYDRDQSPFARTGRPAPDEVAVDTAHLYRLARAAHAPWVPPRAVFTYGAPVGSGRRVSSAQLPFSGVSQRSWSWTGHGWVRSQDGRADRLASGARITATNVVVITSVVRHSGIYDAAHNEDPFDIITGSGTCWVLRGGHLYSGRWTRRGMAAPMRLADAAGRVLTLQPGTTWLELLPEPQRPSFS